MYLLVIFTTLLSISLAPAFKVLAYLDPGSGSFLIQLLIGTLVGAAVIIKTYWGRIRAFFSNSAAEDTSADTESTSETDVPDNA